MKHLFIVLVTALFTLFSIATYADVRVGVVNMRQVFQASPQFKKISAQLKQRFAGERSKLMQLGKKYQANVQQYKRNQSIMSKDQLDKLRKTLGKQQNELRVAQARFQQQLFAAQNKAMGGFMKKLQAVVAKVAQEKKLTLVLPKNSVLYTAGNTNITSSVLDELK